ncbi:hypothetical protein ACFXG6_32370 [Streptomyces roseus]|uniref:hypothetical protein n=1 Tax=Streptomyces roseus TaxID=66430 RepID=UPI0036C379E1
MALVLLAGLLAAVVQRSRRILAIAPIPALAAKLQMWKPTPMRQRAGRSRRIETDTERIQQLVREEAQR